MRKFRAPKGISIVLPVYNEVETIENVIYSYYEKVVSRIDNVEFLVAEDGSTDGTKEKLKEISRKIPLRLLLGDERKGYLGGVRDALVNADKDIVFFSDSDGQHDPKDFWKLVRFINNFDLVCGMRIARNDDFSRKILSRGYNRIIKSYFGYQMYDTNAGFKMMKKEVIKKVVKNIRHITFGFSTELITRAYYAGFNIAGVPVQHISRTSGIADQFTLGKIPKVVMTQLDGLSALRRELIDEIKNKEHGTIKIYH